METNNLINGYIAMEKAVASIYSDFMQLFPKEKDFWEDLLKDEMAHSYFLRDYHWIFNGLQTPNLPLSMPLVEKTLKFAKNISYHVKFNPVSLEEALELALKLQETMVEAFANELIDLSAASNEMSIEKIFMDERLHIDKIRDMMFKKGFYKIL